jgi:hypothetical protein
MSQNNLNSLPTCEFHCWNNSGAVPPAEAEWNFDGVPDGELLACCYGEYARESHFIRETLGQYRDWFQAGGLRGEDRYDSCKKASQPNVLPVCCRAVASFVAT